METCNFCPTLHRSVGQSGGAASGAGAFFKSRRPCGGPAFPPARPPCKLIRNEECFLNQTANYQLCQWDPTDRILMEDFNKDNGKIDTALKENTDAIAAEAAARAEADEAVKAALPLVKILDFTTEAPAPQVDLTVPDLTQYASVTLCLEAAGCPDLALRVNGSTDYECCNAAGSGSGGDYCTELVELWAEDQHPWADIHFSWPRPGAPVRALYFTVRDSTYQGFHCYCQNCTWDEVTAFNLLADSGTVPAGTRVLMYGIQK